MNEIVGASMMKHYFPSEKYAPFLRQRLFRYCVVFVVLAALALHFGFASIFGKGSIGDAAFFGGIFLFYSWAGWCDYKADIKIALYFEKEVTGEWMWSKAIFQQCGYLDEIAQREGFLPLSDFGFKDESRRKAPIWYEAQDGLATTDSLLRCLRFHVQEVEQRKELIEDLEEMRCRLKNADMEDVRFCLIFYQDAINAMEVEQRKGHF